MEPTVSSTRFHAMMRVVTKSILLSPKKHLMIPAPDLYDPCHELWRPTVSFGVGMAAGPSLGEWFIRPMSESDPSEPSAQNRRKSG
jgi:hypothetical protein